jgi:hypothetical protein
MRRMILTGAAVLVLGGALTGCGQSSPQASPTAGNVAAPASAAPASSAPAGSSGPGYTVSCKMASGPNGTWNPVVTVANTGSAPMQLPDLNVVDQPLGFDFEFFGASGAQLGTASDGITPDGGFGIITIEPGSSHAFTFNGTATPTSTVQITSCTALISGYSDAY